MATTVPARTSARQPKSHSTKFQLSALSLVSTTVIHGVTGLDQAWTVVVILVLVVVVPVPGRVRQAAGKVALDVLDRIIHWR